MKLNKRLFSLIAIGILCCTSKYNLKAQSINSVNRVVQVDVGRVTGLNTNGSFKDGLTSHGIVIEPNDGVSIGDIFYLDINNAKWVSEDILNKALAFTTTDSFATTFGANYVYSYFVEDGDTLREVRWQFNITRESDNRLIVKVVNVPYDATIDSPYSILKFQLPLAYIANKGNVSVDVKGGASRVSNGNIIISKTDFEGEVLTIDSGKVPTVHKNSKAADILIRESVPGLFKELGQYNQELRFELTHPDYQFDGTPTVILKDGLYGKNVSVNTKVDTNNPNVLIVNIPAVDTTSIGEIDLTNIKVKTESPRPEEQDLYVNITGNNISTHKLRIGKSDEYDVTINLEENENRDIYAGRSEMTNIKISEVIDGSLIADDIIGFDLEGGYFGSYSGDGSKEEELSKIINVPTGIKITDAKVDKTNKFISFTAKLEKVDNKKLDILDVELPVYAPFNHNENDIELFVRVDGYGRERYSLFSISDSISIGTKVNTVKNGYRKQSLGSITVSEANSSALIKDGEIVIDLGALPADILLSELSNIQTNIVKGSIKLGSPSIDTGNKTVTIPVKSFSREATTIKIDGIMVDVKKSALPRAYDVTITGTALGDDVELDEKYIQVINVAPPVDPIRRGVVEFKVGEEVYSYNGMGYEMDASPFLNKGNIMVPLRYLTEAFGIPGNNLKYSMGTAYVKIGNDTLEVTEGTNIARYKNKDRTLGGKMIVKNGRTYIPLGEIGRILEMEVKWDNDNKVATFIKK